MAGSGGLAVKIVVKIGGVALEDPGTRKKCAEAVAQLVQDGHKVAVVHGGGSTITRMLERLGKKNEFVDGLRVTDAETRDVVLMVLAGTVNKQLVATIAAAGPAAVGLCGGDGMGFLARKKFVGGRDLGFVGEIASADPRWVEAIWQQSGVPVLAPVSLGADGEYYNVNADEMASACAVACQANALIFLTDVPGVKNANGVVISSLSTTEIDRLIATTVISGGMLPKLDACRRALQRGVGRVRILPAAQVEVLPEFYFSKVQCGTEVMVA
jgi:acetylglutamate kinase